MIPRMRSWARGALRFLTWLAVLWTIYAEQRHLLLYLGDREIAFGAGEYVDLLVTAVLLLFAVYEVFHFVGATRALERYVAVHPALDLLRVFLLAALCWGIYRDLSHFNHLILVAFADRSLDEEIDNVAGIALAFGALKTGYHVWHVWRSAARLARSR